MKEAEFLRATSDCHAICADNFYMVVKIVPNAVARAAERGECDGIFYPAHIARFIHSWQFTIFAQLIAFPILFYVKILK